MPLFLYGTLLDDVLRARLVGREVASVAAYLSDYRVVAQPDGLTPALVAAPGDLARGILLTDLTQDEVQRLDVYEAAFDYMSADLTVEVDGEAQTARVYLPGPDVAKTETSWSFDTWEAARGALSRERAVEIGTANPPYTATTLRQQWKMIGSRASGRLRAAVEEAPSNLRYSPARRDFSAKPHGIIAGNFFKFRQFEMTHATFRGDTSPALPREAMIGVDAAIILPYDPVADTVLLVEQIRTGPLMRGAPNPWSLEPVAGMIDPGETPEQSALRETEEEAGLTGITLEKMFGCYPSPGGSTDYFYCYLALGALPAPTSYIGGLPEEHEDLRLHVIPFEDAMALIETGEANIGPLIAMLLWLDRERVRLRGTA